ncbi:MAG: hypothetical protein DRP11_05040, partial [Candidatus Aenigmatarchaeota archaeon]
MKAYYRPLWPADIVEYLRALDDDRFGCMRKVHLRANLGDYRTEFPAPMLSRDKKEEIALKFLNHRIAQYSVLREPEWVPDFSGSRDGFID